jgi:hypothetical protein
MPLSQEHRGLPISNKQGTNRDLVLLPDIFKLIVLLHSASTGPEIRPPDLAESSSVTVSGCFSYQEG